MNNQSITTDLDAFERPVGLREAQTLKPSLSPASTGLIARAETYCPKEDGLSARLVAAEQVGSFLVEVPRATARQRRTLLTFAVEDRIAAPIQSVQVGMGEPVLILAFVVIVIGGIGSIKGALVGALLVGLTDTLGGLLLPEAFKLFMETSDATATGSALASMLIYILMAVVLVWRPRGLFGGAT